MFDNFFKKIQKPLAGLIIVALIVISLPAKTYALLGIADFGTVIVAGDVSPTGIANNINHTMQRLKSFVLDRLATMIAKQILHQMTVSVINWINNGFEGSPAFLTNPEAFFLDVADQVTGAYLATDGPLSSLCTPFSIDIRLSLALSQTSLVNQRYTCTLGQIIQAQKNGPDITVNGRVINSSISGFTGGDFSQGGWPAFLAITTEPQNNPYGAFLYAQADLNARIASKQNKIQADIQIGNGFLSWESCKDIPGATVSDEYEDAEAAAILGNDPSVRRKENKDGTAVYQSCETQTPGSVISHTLMTNLDVPVVELELANDINAIINALVNRMITTMLSSGLHALSGGGSGGDASYTDQLLNESANFEAAEASRSASDLSLSVQPVIDQTVAYKVLYDQAVSNAQASKTRYLTAQSCFANIVSNPMYNQMPRQTYALNQVNNIAQILSSAVDPKIEELKSKQKIAAEELKELEDFSYSLAGTGSVEVVNQKAVQYSDFVQSGRMNTEAKASAAQTTLDTTITLVNAWNNDAGELLQRCQTSQ